jgi:hypothetical protein
MRLLFLQLLCFLWIPIEEKINLYKGEPLQRVITWRKKSDEIKAIKKQF